MRRWLETIDTCPAVASKFTLALGVSMGFVTAMIAMCHIWTHPP